VAFQETALTVFVQRFGVEFTRFRVVAKNFAVATMDQQAARTNVRSEKEKA